MKIKNRMLLNVIVLLFVAITTYTIYLVFNSTSSLSEPVTYIWDGTSVSSDFSGGNGTINNPYLIKTGNDFAYFQKVMEEYPDIYNSAYYTLVSDINLGQHEISPISEFKGVFDGNGYSIMSFNLKNNYVDNKENYYGLFTSLENATIKNLNINDVKLISNPSDTLTYLGVLSGKISNSNVWNISIFNVESTGTFNDNKFKVGFIAGSILNNNTFKNIAIINALPTGFSTISQSSLSNNTYENIFVLEGQENKLISIDQTINNANIYTISDQMEIKYNGLAVEKENFLNIWNENLTDDYSYVLTDNNLKLTNVSSSKNKFFSNFEQKIEIEDTTSNNDTVYVNDLLKDWNEYIGFNYTTSNDGTIPSISNKKIYDESNLVQVQINYNGYTTLQDGTYLSAYLSLEEKYNKYVYYKTYSINDNGTDNKNDDYIEIELIDNPFALLPKDYAFNGWITKDNNVTISYNPIYYSRYAKIPVTYTDNTANSINVVFDISFTDANVVKMSEYNSFNNAISKFYDYGMQKVELKKTYYEPYDMSGYYYKREAQSGTRYSGYTSTGQYVNNQRCNGNWNQSTCTYYELIENENYNQENTYYQLVNNRMTIVDSSDIPLVSYTELNPLFNGMNMAGFYRKVTINRNNSIDNYYDEVGTPLTGNCTSNTCSVYQLITYYKSDGGEELVDEDSEYYYLVTRDTNILVLDSNITGNWSSHSKPFTLTGLYDNTDYRNQYMWTLNSSNVTCYSDTRIEYVKIYSSQRPANTDPSSSSGGWYGSSSNTLYGNYNNVKIGRGLIKNGTYQNFASVIGGGTQQATSSQTNTVKYRLIIESGFYNSIALVNGTSGTANYVEVKGVYGNDFDRVSLENNNLDIYYCAAGAWGGNINSVSNKATAISLVVKSGSFGTGKYDYSTGIYVGGRSGGTHNALRSVTVEGGYIYNLIGGPLSGSNRSQINDIFMSIKGGSIDMIVGGAGRSATYGNRIIQVTGGIVNYSVFGGSNGYLGSSSEGTLNGSTYLYIGGNAVIGNDEYINNNDTLFGSEAGSVFGIGNGRVEYTTVGSCDNSYIIIDQDAIIKRNVYGGGNYGATGVSSSNNTTQTIINIYGGNILGSVFGGGNKNGSGSTQISSSININMTDGIVSGSIYGGSNETGTIYGDVNLNIENGHIISDIYGGGLGGSINSTVGTYVSGNVYVVVGKDSKNEPIIDGNVYGGGSYGSVNTTSTSNNKQTSVTNVTINNGLIRQSVFGGGKGDETYSPIVQGDITLTVNDGSISRVFGGNDANGVPSGNIYVYLKNGIIQQAYGGGNNTGANDTNIYLQGATLTSLYGGSNQDGSVNTSNVVLEKGTSIYVYGGNNAGGSIEKTNVNINGGKYTNVFGGNNSSGTNEQSNIVLNNGNVVNVFGGGNKAKTNKTNIETINGNANYIYGGGNEAGTENSNVNLKGGNIYEVYGGSNKEGEVLESNVTSEIDDEHNKDVEMLIDYTSYNVTWQQTTYKYVLKMQITLKNNTSSNINNYDALFSLEDSKLNTNYSQVSIIELDGVYKFDQDNRYYSQGKNTIPANGTFTFEFEIFTNKKPEEIEFYKTLNTKNDLGISSSYTNRNVQNIYGGNNLGGTTTKSIVKIISGSIGNVYGGGNEAITENNVVNIEGGTIGNVYGGGNRALTTDSTLVNITGGVIDKCVYGGGNHADVLKNSTVNVSANPTIGNNLFAGGNSGAIGDKDNNNSVAVVNVVGAKILGNVYGGCNTSVVYGTTNVNIGINTVSDKTLTQDNIEIVGTVFGGGEANADGDENFDWTFICVTTAIHVNIDGLTYLDNGYTFNLTGSIFGSGNASSSKGTSDIYIANLGTSDNPSKNISIQRTDTLIIDNSVLELSGAVDTTNDYATYKYSFNRISLLKIKNGTTLLLKENANLLERIESKVDIDGKEEIAKVSFDDDLKTVTKNVDNRIYLLANTILNVSTNQAGTSYGEVIGMTFLGMYNSYQDGSYIYGLYDKDMTYGQQADAGDVIAGGSYVIGLHTLNHEIDKNGFYTNYIDDEYTTITTAYIEPTPPDAEHYMWTIGIEVINYDIDLKASKYASMGTKEVSLIQFADGNTNFDIIGFNSEGLIDGVSLVDVNNVPKLAKTEEEANSIFGLSMKTETTEWTNHDTTKFTSDNKGTVNGQKHYKTDSIKTAPSLMFYLYNAKNISTNRSLGTVVVTLQASTKSKDSEIEMDVKMITITINLTQENIQDGDYYDASITYGKKYEMPSATLVNITNKSQFTAYFSLYSQVEDFESFFGKNNDYYHVLNTNFALPVNTRITMIDYGVGDNTPEYYYLEIDEETYNRTVEELKNNNEVAYKLSDFIRMGSISSDNTYNEEDSNKKHYYDDKKLVMEEYVFIFDFVDTDLNEDYLNNSILMELRNSEDRCIIPVLGIRQQVMSYNLYQVSNMILQQTVSFIDTFAYHNGYTDINYKTNVAYDETTNRESIIDTNYESSSMGVNITIYDSSKNMVSSTLLTGTSIVIDDVEYYSDSDGIFRIKLSDKVSNLVPQMQLHTGNLLPAGNYSMRFVLFASEDGLHNSSTLSTDITSLDFTVVGDNNMIITSVLDSMKLIDSVTGLNQDNSNEQVYKITYHSVLENPNIRVSLYKRKTDSYDTQEYEEIPITTIFNEILSQPEAVGLQKKTSEERLVYKNPDNYNEFNLTLKENLTTGTYRLEFKLYDNNYLIDSDIEYLIIRK